MGSGAFLQSKEWGNFQASLGRRVERIFGDGWSAQLIETRLPFGQSYWSCPKGPVVVAQSEPPVVPLGKGDVQFDSPPARGGARGGGRLREGLYEFGRSHGAAFIRLEPSMEIPGTVKTLDIQPAETLMTDLTQTEEQLLAGMHHKTRYNIRVAEKHGVKIRFDAALAEVWPLFEETARRDGFRLHDCAYYERMLESLSRGACRAFLATASLGGRLLAANLMIDFGDTRTYLHGASSNFDRNVMAPYLLHWELIRDAKAKGLAWYDWWGIAGVGSEREKAWAGITRFKRGFGGEEVKSPGTFDLPIVPWKYALYRLARRFVRT